VHRNIAYDRKIVSSHILLSLKVRCVSVGTRLNLFSCMSARARACFDPIAPATRIRRAHERSNSMRVEKRGDGRLPGTHMAGVSPVPAQMWQA
jgi:hypothetical protein